MAATDGKALTKDLLSEPSSKPPREVHPTLQLFTRLSSRVSLYNPPDTSHEIIRSRNSTDPTTIVFLAWTHAAPKHYAKFLTHYMSLYPHARIVLSTITLQEFMSPSVPTLMKVTTPVATALLPDKSRDASEGNERILIHAFSNGGVKRLWALARVYASKTGQPLPAQLVISDSAPGVAGRFWRDVGVLGKWPPKNPLALFFFKAMVYALAGSLWFIFHCTPFWSSFFRQPRADINNERYVSKAARRVYVYSEEDKVIDWRDVEAHADEAKRNGMEVEKVKVPGTEHCAHAKGERWEEYWNLVVGAWARSQSVI